MKNDINLTNYLDGQQVFNKPGLKISNGGI